MNTQHTSPSTGTPNRTRHTHRTRATLQAAFALACASLLAACGGGDDNSTTPGAPAPGAPTVAAPLVITSATPSTLNGTLDKAAALFEHGSSNQAMTTYAGSDDHCRVAAYTVKNSGDGKNYYLELSFKKSDRSVGRIHFGLDAGLSLLATAVPPLTGVTVDVANRRLVFNNVLVGNAPGTATSITLNGSLEYPSNVAAADRTACG